MTINGASNLNLFQARHALRESLCAAFSGLYPTHENTGPPMAIANAVDNLIEAWLRELLNKPGSRAD